MEGTTFPFFAFAFSPEKIQYNFDLSIENNIDHGKNAVKFALHFSNFFVDEARMNGNFFSTKQDE